MKQLEDILSDLKDNMDDMTFGDVIRIARERMGIIQYKAANFMNLTMARLKRLEINQFRIVPPRDEIESICDFYRLPVDKMTEKAELHVDNEHKEISKADRYFSGRR